MEAKERGHFTPQDIEDLKFPVVDEQYSTEMFRVMGDQFGSLVHNNDFWGALRLYREMRRRVINGS